MKIIKIVSLVVAALSLATLSIGSVQARGGHARHCGIHKHLDQGTMHCVWNYGAKKSHHKM
jgi:hypothetical protein